MDIPKNRARGGATPYLRLLSHPSQTAMSLPTSGIHSPFAEGRRLSWPEWLVTYQDGKPGNGGHPSQC